MPDFRNTLTLNGDNVSVDGHQHLTTDLTNLANSGIQLRHGFPFPYTVTLSYSATNRQVTITPSGATFDVWINGVKFTKTEQVSPAHDNTTGNYFIYYDEAGDLQVSTTPWDINGTAIPVCYIYYNATLIDSITLFELHTATRNPAWHKSQHFSIGTYVKSGLELSGYTLNSAVDASLTIAIASGVIVDEDIDYTLSALADNGPYTVFRRSGTDWTWTTTNSVPYLFTTNGYIQWNENSGGSYRMTQAVTARFVNYYLFCTTALPHTFAGVTPVSTSNKRFLFVPAQAIHTSLSAAQLESVASIVWGGILIPEIVGVWKFTYETKSNNNSSGKVQLVEVSRVSLTRSQLTGSFTAGSHNALTGREAVDSHPIAAITDLQTTLDGKENVLGNPTENGQILTSTTLGVRSWTTQSALIVKNTPSGNIAATNVQAAINELDSEKLSNTTSLSEINDALVDNDELPVYDLSADVNKKTLVSRVWTYISGKLASPPAIGGTTPAAGSFTTLSSKVTNTSPSTTINKASDFTAIGLRIDGLYSNQGDKIPIVWGTNDGISCAINGGRVNTSTWDSEFDFYCNNVTSGPNGVDAIQKVATLSSAGLAIKGIKFPATQSASSDVNTLDDYEEGTWTATYGARTATGYYTKIGRIVHVHVILDNTATFSSITGLPFTCSSAGYSPAFIARGLGSSIDFATLHIGVNETNLVILNPSAGTSPSITTTGLVRIEIASVYQV